jgi:hypothetical protein
MVIPSQSTLFIDIFFKIWLIYFPSSARDRAILPSTYENAKKLVILFFMATFIEMIQGDADPNNKVRFQMDFILLKYSFNTLLLVCVGWWCWISLLFKNMWQL